tara:strand:- start:2698 stop:2832 length:135 start_codon:yes stop_codon:yes gene_type:complete
MNNDNIVKFIQHVSEKNYAEANKYLQAAIEAKMKNRIQKVVEDN